jgi:CDP-diacylglycerol--serine O-phosphatidyltransferase
MRFLRLISIADILTLGNAFCGVFAIIFLYINNPDITIGSSLIIIGMIFDGLDGLAARKFGTKHDYGKYLDSIADAITFGLAPAYLIVIIFMPTGAGSRLTELQALIVVLTAVITAGLGIYRLIKFSLEGHKKKHFSGLATPAFAFLIIILAHILDPHRSENNFVMIPFFACAIILMGDWLLISEVRYPKVRGRTAVRLAAAFIIGLASLFILKMSEAVDAQTIFIYYRILSILALIAVVGYVIFAPVYLRLAETSPEEEKVFIRF